MRTRRHGSVTISLLAITLLAGLAENLPAQEQAPHKCRTPRSTVQTLFAAVSGARQNPRLLADAIACLDLTGRQAGPGDADHLAIQLESVLRATEVNTELIPDEVAGGFYRLPGLGDRWIQLRRQSDGRWLFDQQTVEQIPQMAAEARKLLQDKNKEAASLNIAPEVASPRATFRTFLMAYAHGDSERLLRCFNLSEVPAAARQEVGEQLGRKLCQIIFRQRALIFQDIPDSNYSDTYSWLSLPEGSIELVRMPSGDHKGEWLFSRQTVRTIDRLYQQCEDKPYHEMLLSIPADRLRPDLWRAPELWLRERLPAWSKADLSPVAAWRVEAYQLIGCVLLIVLAFSVSRVGTLLLAALVRCLLALGGWKPSPAITATQMRSSGRLLACLVLRSGLLLLDLDKALLGLALTILNPVVWLLGMWAVFRIMDLIGDVTQERLSDSKHKVEITEMLWPVGSLAIKILLGLGVVLHLMSLFAWEVTAVLTGLGIGGVAFALGAQDSLRNLFGSFTLLADRPFVVGETVQIGAEGVGVVERVGLRSTIIRTVEDTVIIVPNSNLTTMNITNFGRRRFRRFTTGLGIAYGTAPERLTAFCNGIRQMILTGKWTRKEQFEVAVRELTAASIEVEISVYFDVTTRQEEVAAREALLLGCLRLAEEFHVALAFPTPTVPSDVDAAAGAPSILGARGDEESKPAAA